MGNGSSKSKHEMKALRDDQMDVIASVLHSANSTTTQMVTRDMLENLWHDKLSDGLRKRFYTYLFRQSLEIKLADFATFYYNMVEASIEDRAKTIQGLLGIDSNIPPRNFQTYVADMIESYMIILQFKCPQTYSTWKSGDLTTHSDISAISYYFIKDINYLPDGMVPMEELEAWLQRTAFLKEVSESVMKVAYGFGFQLKPVLPKADRMSTLLRIPTVLLLSHLTRSILPDWRLLYSSSAEAHSWQILQKLIRGQGPTVILIQDQEGPLIGAYASQSWKIAPSFYGNEDCFLFRLRPELLLCFPTGYNQNFQYLNSGASTLPNGIGMGGQLNYFGIFLSSEFGPGFVSKTCTTFRDYVPLASALQFSFLQLEIWATGSPDLSPEEEGIRKGPGVLSSDPGALAMLEMAGKAGHAKAAGELQE